MSKDWTGNKQSAFSILGARVFAQHDRAEHDYYATSPEAVEELLKVEQFSPKVWECGRCPFYNMNCKGTGRFCDFPGAWQDIE